jgi:hypothetical protein
MSPDPDSVIQLESGKFYHFAFADAPSNETLRLFSEKLRENGVRGIITLGEVKVTDLAVLIQGMSASDRKLIVDSLNYVDPREHEQTK